jgi:hypothetical protein
VGVCIVLSVTLAIVNGVNGPGATPTVVVQAAAPTQPAATIAPTVVPPTAVPTQPALTVAPTLAPTKPAPPPPTAIPSTAPPVVAKPGVKPETPTTCPDTYPIKGNVGTNGRIYHVRGFSRAYNQTQPEFCFDTVESARAAGFRAAEQ